MFLKDIGLPNTFHYYKVFSNSIIASTGNSYQSYGIFFKFKMLSQPDIVVLQNNIKICTGINVDNKES